MPFEFLSLFLDVKRPLNRIVMKNVYATLLLALGFSVSAAADNWMSRLPDHLYVAQVLMDFVGVDEANGYATRG